MKIIRNKYIPFQGYKAINLFGILFVKPKAVLDDRTLNHEAIHTAQIKEVMTTGALIAAILAVFGMYGLAIIIAVFSYYILYILEWIYRLIRHKGKAYRNISFEREAYENDDDLEYLQKRKRYSFINYLFY